MDFKNVNGVWNPKRFCIICVELPVLNFCLSKFCFQFEVFLKLDFQMHKTHLKSFVFNILFIGDYNLALYLFDGNV